LEDGIGKPAVVELEARTLVGMSFFDNPFTSHAGWTEETPTGVSYSRPDLRPRWRMTEYGLPAVPAVFIVMGLLLRGVQ
jgi:hypothetical protein